METGDTGQGTVNAKIKAPGLSSCDIWADKIKAIYDIVGKCFRVGHSTGPLAPKDVQSLLELPEVVVAIAKALRFLGY